MKKFVTVIISFVVLMVFLVLNYLLWDKENLLKLRDNDKIEQDWLRGQNLTLQTTVDELEQKVEELTGENDSQKDKIMELESKVSTALVRENDNMKKIQLQNDALNDYKSFMKDKLEEIAVKWFGDITDHKYEESFAYLDKNTSLWGKFYTASQYPEFISSLQSIELQKEASKDTKSFIVMEDQGDPYDIRARASVELSVKKELPANLEDLKSGPGTLEILFRYIPDSKSWVIKSVSAVQAGKP